MDRNKCVYIKTERERERERERDTSTPSSVTIMRTTARFLHSTTATTTAPAISIDSDMVVILASLLCAFICVAGLALVARCACRRARLRQQLLTTGTIAANGSSPAPRGLKKTAIDALPVVTAAGGGGVCAICLADFAAGEELIRVLPHCGHGFHVACIDTWLGAHATCPSCRATIVGSSSPAPPLPDYRRCRTCGATCDDAAAAAAASARNESSFLP